MTVIHGKSKNEFRMVSVWPIVWTLNQRIIDDASDRWRRPVTACTDAEGKHSSLYADGILRSYEVIFSEITPANRNELARNFTWRRRLTWHVPLMQRRTFDAKQAQNGGEKHIFRTFLLPKQRVVSPTSCVGYIWALLDLNTT